MRRLRRAPVPHCSPPRQLIALGSRPSRRWRRDIRAPHGPAVAVVPEADPAAALGRRIRALRQAPRRTMGKLSVVQPAGAEHALVGELRRGAGGGFDLQPWNSEIVRDLQLDWAAPVIEIRPRYGR